MKEKLILNEGIFDDNSPKDWFGVKGVRFVSHGTQSDPMIEFEGKEYDYWDVEEYLYDDYKAYCEDNNIAPDEDDFWNNWLPQNTDSISCALIDLQPENPIRHIRSNMLTMDNGEVLYVNYEDGKLFAGGATNNGIIPETEIDYDFSDSIDGNLQALYDKVIEEHPEYLGESCKNESRQPEAACEGDAKELYMYAINTADLYPQYQAIVKNLNNKFKKGIFDKNLAIKAFEYLAKSAATKYAKEFGSEGYSFNPATRKRAAEMILDSAMDEIELNEEFDYCKSTSDNNEYELEYSEDDVSDVATWLINEYPDETVDYEHGDLCDLLSAGPRLMTDGRLALLPEIPVRFIYVDDEDKMEDEYDGNQDNNDEEDSDIIDPALIDNESCKSGKCKKIVEENVCENPVIFTKISDNQFDWSYCDDELHFLCDESGIIVLGNRHLKEYGDPELLATFKDGIYKDDVVDEDEDAFVEGIEALCYKTGKEYDYSTIRGYSQGDWDEVYYPVGTPKNVIDDIETYMFGKLDEFMDEGNCMYVVPHDYSWKGAEETKKVLAGQSGVDANCIKLQGTEYDDIIDAEDDIEEAVHVKNPIYTLTEKRNLKESRINFEDMKYYAYKGQTLYRIIATRMEGDRSQMFTIGIGTRLEGDAEFEPVVRSARYTTEESCVFISADKAEKFLTAFKREYKDADTEGLHVAEYNPIYPVVKLFPINTPCGKAFLTEQDNPKKKKKEAEKANENLNETFDCLYSANAYYDSKLAGLEDSFETDDISELKDWVWEKMQQCSVEVINNATGNSLVLSIDDFKDDLMSDADPSELLNDAFREVITESMINESVVSASDLKSEIKNEIENLQFNTGAYRLDENNLSRICDTIANTVTMKFSGVEIALDKSQSSSRLPSPTTIRVFVKFGTPMNDEDREQERQAKLFKKRYQWPGCKVILNGGSIFKESNVGDTDKFSHSGAGMFERPTNRNIHILFGQWSDLGGGNAITLDQYRSLNDFETRFPNNYLQFAASQEERKQAIVAKKEKDFVKKLPAIALEMVEDDASNIEGGYSDTWTSADNILDHPIFQDWTKEFQGFVNLARYKDELYDNYCKIINIKYPNY